MQVARDSRGMRELKKREKKTFEERELKRQGREKRKTLERGESPERQPKRSGILEIFKESAGVPVRASLHPLLLSLSSYSPSPFSISRGISFKAKKARGREEGGCDGFRCADTSSPRRTFLPSSSHNSSILREGEVRKNTEKLFEGRSSSLKSRIYV